MACVGCTYESLAFKKNTYIFLSEEKTRIAEELNAGRARAFATETEAERLQNLLIQKGYNAKIVLAPIGDEMLCIQKKNKSALL